MNLSNPFNNGAAPSAAAVKDSASALEARADGALASAKESVDELRAKASGFGERIKDGLTAAGDSLGLNSGAKAQLRSAGEQLKGVAEEASETVAEIGDDAYAAGAQIVKSVMGAYYVARDYLKANPRKSAAVLVAVVAVGAVVLARRTPGVKAA